MECYPGTNVYVNKLGIQNADDLETVEAVLSAKRNQEFFESPDSVVIISSEARFSLEHYCDIHRYLFQDIYPWAGELRTFSMRKNFLRPFSFPEDFAEFAASIFTDINNDDELFHGDIQQASVRLGHYMSMVNIMHPFPEGNGRAQRAYVWLLAQDAGYHLMWDRVSKHEIHAAAILLMRDSDKAGMEELIRQIIKPA